MGGLESISLLRVMPDPRGPCGRRRIHRQRAGEKPEAGPTETPKRGIEDAVVVRSGKGGCGVTGGGGNAGSSALLKNRSREKNRPTAGHAA